jgi:hypothetical protein
MLTGRLVQLLREFPGTLTGNIPPAQRGLLRKLEAAGRLESKPHRRGRRWYLKQT